MPQFLSYRLCYELSPATSFMTHSNMDRRRHPLLFGSGGVGVYAIFERLRKTACLPYLCPTPRAQLLQLLSRVTHIGPWPQIKSHLDTCHIQSVLFLIWFLVSTDLPFLLMVVLPNPFSGMRAQRNQQLGHAPTSGLEVKNGWSSAKAPQMQDNPEGVELDLADDICRYCKKNSPSVLSCIDKRTREGFDCDSGVWTVYSRRNEEGSVPLRNRHHVLHQRLAVSSWWCSPYSSLKWKADMVRQLSWGVWPFRHPIVWNLLFPASGFIQTKALWHVWFLANSLATSVILKFQWVSVMLVYSGTSRPTVLLPQPEQDFLLVPESGIAKTRIPCTPPGDKPRLTTLCFAKFHTSLIRGIGLPPLFPAVNFLTFTAMVTVAFYPLLCRINRRRILSAAPAQCAHSPQNLSHPILNRSASEPVWCTIFGSASSIWSKP